MPAAPGAPRLSWHLISQACCLTAARALAEWLQQQESDMGDSGGGRVMARRRHPGCLRTGRRAENGWSALLPFLPAEFLGPPPNSEAMLTRLCMHQVHVVTAVLLTRALQLYFGRLTGRTGMLAAQCALQPGLSKVYSTLFQRNADAEVNILDMPSLKGKRRRERAECDVQPCSCLIALGLSNQRHVPLCDFAASAGAVSWRPCDVAMLTAFRQTPWGGSPAVSK